MTISIILSIIINFLAFIRPILVILGCLIITMIWVIPSKKAEKCDE